MISINILIKEVYFGCKLVLYNFASVYVSDSNVSEVIPGSILELVCFYFEMCCLLCDQKMIENWLISSMKQRQTEQDL